jgi:hypothetical protein
MDSSNHQEWIPEQRTQFSSLDSVLTSESLAAGQYSLPPIPEEPLVSDWFPELDPFDYLEPSLQDVPEPKPDEVTALQLFEDFVKQIQQIRQEMSDLHVIGIEKYDALEKTVTIHIKNLDALEKTLTIHIKKLETLEKTVTIHQRYVSSLVPWSKEVYKKYSELLEVISEKAGGCARE